MTIVDEFRRDEARVLDRLVDGELGQSQRRELLAALDDEPGSWRRCALAFLEAQSWRWQLAKVASEPIVAQSAAAGSRRALLRRASWTKFWGACLALAGSLLLAFGLGSRFPGAREPQLAATAADPIVVAQSDTAPTNAAPDAEAGGSTEPAAEPPWETLTLTSADDAGNTDPRSKIEVHARSAQDADFEELLSGQESTVAAALVERLEQAGWNVTRERRLLPVDLSDGRRMVVPIEQVDIHNPDVAKF
jgi:hypothetical protein